MPYRLIVALTGWLLLTCGVSSTTHAADIAPPVEGLDTPESVLALSSGFLAKDLPVEGFIFEDNSDSKLIMGTRTVVYVRMQNFDNLAPGDLFTVYRKVRQVYHPAHGQYLGWMVGIRGIAQVLKIDLDIGIVTMKVIRAFSDINPGDVLMRYVPPLPQEPQPETRSIPEHPAMIVELVGRQTLVGRSNIVFLDWGKEEGLARGDHLDIFRPKLGRPIRWVGEARILSVQDHTSTALLVRSPVNVLRGDRLVLKEAPKPPIQAEADLKPLENEIKGVDVKREGDRLVITMVDQVLFDSGEAEIKPSGREILKRVGDVLKGAEGQKIFVEGHTDNVRIGPKLQKVFANNWELSRARAVSVRQFLTDEGGIEPTRITAAEYADTRPVASNKTEEGRQKNRRVEIILMPKEAPGDSAAPLTREEKPLPPITLQQPPDSAKGLAPAVVRTEPAPPSVPPSPTPQPAPVEPAPQTPSEPVPADPGHPATEPVAPVPETTPAPVQQ